MGGFPDLSELALRYRREYGTKALRMVRYGLRLTHPTSVTIVGWASCPSSVDILSTLQEKLLQHFSLVTPLLRFFTKSNMIPIFRFDYNY